MMSKLKELFGGASFELQVSARAVTLSGIEYPLLPGEGAQPTPLRIESDDELRLGFERGPQQPALFEERARDMG